MQLYFKTSRILNNVGIFLCELNNHKAQHPIVKGPHGVNLHTIELHHTGQPVVRIWVDLQVVESR